MVFRTQFCIDGKFVELDDLIEKTAKWDFVNSVSGFTPEKFVEQGKKLKAIKKILTKDDWDIIDCALSTASLYAQGMDLMDINELQTGKLYRLRDILEE